MPEHDLCIYAPGAWTYYDGHAASDGGGAERQTYLLARALAERGLRVAHVVYPVAAPVAAPEAPVTLVTARRPDRHGSAADLASRSRAVWRALGQADARVQVFRGANGTLGVAALWARRHGRRLVFAGANDSDFTLENFGGPRDPRRRLYTAGLRRADRIVVQTDDQAALARAGFPGAAPVQLNSFVAPAEAAPGPGEAFLWVSRLVGYKRPLAYADLAAAMPQARFWMITTRSATSEHDRLRAELERRAATLTNLELLDQRPHAELQQLIGRAVAMVNTSEFEGMPNTWLEGWARGVPALTLSFDPDGRIARHGLGTAAGGSWEDFVAGARRLWDARAARDLSVQAYVREVHGRRVGDGWAALVQEML